MAKVGNRKAIAKTNLGVLGARYWVLGYFSPYLETMLYPD